MHDYMNYDQACEEVREAINAGRAVDGGADAYNIEAIVEELYRKSRRGYRRFGSQETFWWAVDQNKKKGK